MTPSATTESSFFTRRIEHALTAADLVVAGLLFLTVFATGVIHLESLPPLWFDEGWTLCVARTWVERGHYGCLLQGELAAPVLSGHFPVVASIALSFKLFGIGIWQARAVGLLYTYVALLMLYVIVRRLYGQPIATVALGLLIFVPFKWSIHPLFLGRQVLGEMPMLCFLLAGYACVLRSKDGPGWLAAAIGCWSVAWMAKGQVAPFFIASLAGTALLLGFRGQWSTARRSVLLLGGSWVGYQLLMAAKSLLLAGHTLPNPPANGLTEAIAMVFVPSIRLETIEYMLFSWPEYTLGVGYAAWRLLRADALYRGESLEPAVRTMLLLLSGSWLAWFALLSAGEPRYAFPGLFVAASFTAALFYDFTKGFSATFVRASLSAMVQRRRMTGDGAKVLVVVALLIVMGSVVVQERYAFRGREDERDLFELIAYLHTATPASALIETYDSELFLFLNRRYTYAPPQALVDVIRHHQDPNHPIRYDALQAKPTLLVVGEYGRWAEFYQPLIKQGRVRLVQTIGRYQIYQPVSSQS